MPIKSGYTIGAYYPVVTGAWSDKYAVMVANYNDNTKMLAIRNAASVDYTWTIKALVLYVKNL